MSCVRVLFLAKYRVPHACMSMQFDHYLEGIDHTVIASPMSREELLPIFDRHNIDSSRFEFLSDSVIYENYPEVNDWVFADDYRGWWLRQQAIKLSVLDYLEHDVMLMHDPDTFMIEPYRCWDQGKLNYCVLEDTTHGSYNGMIDSIFGFPRQTTHCFITELVPCLKQDITDMKQYLQQKHNTHWLNALIDNTTKLPTIPPWGTGNLIRWFSEYEVIGNWAMHQREVDFTFQRRYEYDTMDKLGNLTRDFNAVCDAIPDLSLSLQFDWDRGEVVNFDHWMAVINSRLNAKF